MQSRQLLLPRLAPLPDVLEIKYFESIRLNIYAVSVGGHVIFTLARNKFPNNQSYD